MNITYILFEKTLDLFFKFIPPTLYSNFDSFVNYAQNRCFINFTQKAFLKTAINPFGFYYLNRL